MQAKIYGHDVLHLPTSITWANVEWYWDNFTVWGGAFPYGNDDDGYWDVVYNTHGSGYYSSPARYEHYHYTHWYSSGFPNSSFPDVDVWFQPTAIADAGGTGDCAWWWSPGSGWDSYDPPGGEGLHPVFQCVYY